MGGRQAVEGGLCRWEAGGLWKVGCAGVRQVGCETWAVQVEGRWAVEGGLYCRRLMQDVPQRLPSHISKSPGRIFSLWI